MHVLVTGGTGYVGSHSIAALSAAGHRVRVLTRSPERIAATLDSLNVDGIEAAVGDVTDPASVEGALDGCDAVLHAASVFSMDPRKAEEMKWVNVRGTETVLRTAHGLGLDPIVHVSSEVALLPAADGEILTAYSRVQRPAGTYSQTKADSELVARRFQAQGAPVVSIMPAAIWGPHDPNFGEGVTLAANILRNRFPIIMSGGMHIADVRDVAAVNAAVMVRGQGPRAYLVAGQYISMPDIVHKLADLSGRRIPFVIVPSWFLAGFGHTADFVQRRLKARLPWSSEAIWIMNCHAHCDDSRTRNEFGLEPRPLRDTFADTVHWLVEVGKLSRRQAGRLA